MDIQSAIQLFIRNKIAIGLSKSTIQYYRSNLVLFSDFTGNVNVTELDASVFLAFQNYLIENFPQTKNTSLQTYARAAKVFLRWLHENSYINIEICKLTLLKAEQPNIFPLLDSEIEILLNYFDDSYLGIRNKIICLLMLDSGLRRGEVVSLKRDWIIMNNRTMKVFGKGSKERLLPFGTTTQKYMSQFISISNKNCAFLLQDKNGEQITDNTIKMMFQKLKKSTGIERIHPHLLRHTFATNYLLDGGNLEELRILMGHTDIEMTRKYIHLAEQQKILNQRFVSHIDKIIC